MGKVYKGVIAGDLFLNKGDDASQVTTIGGSLDVRQGATCDLPVCTTIGGSIDVRQGATCDLPVCTTIGGSLYVRQGATCDLPVCTTIGGFLELYPRSKLNAPKLETISGKPVGDPAAQSALLKQVAEAALAGPSNLIMDGWHNESGRCGTAHCIAGWAVHLSGKEGYDLEDEVGSATAGAILLGTEAATMFFLSEDEARGRLEMIRQGVS